MIQVSDLVDQAWLLGTVYIVKLESMMAYGILQYVPLGASPVARELMQCRLPSPLLA